MNTTKRWSTFWRAVLTVCLLALTIHPFAMAQQFAPVPKTGQTQSYETADDGDLPAGVKWPEPRFTDNGDGTVTDNLTNLVWLKNANCFGSKTWIDALDASNNLAHGQCGLSDGSPPGTWRLANARELLSLIDYDNYSPALAPGYPFTHVHSGNYWSSTTLASRTEAALLVNMRPEFGKKPVLHNASKSQRRGVWPVRVSDEATFSTAPVPKTGQTQSYATGDDGGLQEGVKWPEPRFTDNGDGTVTDNLTDLIWLKNANCFGSKTWIDAVDAANSLADGQCGLSDGSLSGKWRLANIKQLHSLIDHGNNIAFLPSKHPFADVQSAPYWSSTTNASNAEEAWHMPVGNVIGHNYGIMSHPKSKAGYVLPVRDMKPTTMIVDIDIKPGCYPNDINLESKGEVPVVIFTTDDFDAYDVDIISCEFAGAYPLHWKMEDVDKDGRHDMLLRFLIQELNLTKRSTEATFKGKTFDGIQIIGADSVNSVPTVKEADGKANQNNS
jgi:hypothetical protein